jgi:pyruvate dehydrogenase E1 component beta subunit
MEEMDRDPSVFILGEEVGVWGGSYAVTKGFYDKYGPERVKDTPIAENAILGGAIGAAMVGQRPVAELMTINFAFSAMDFIVNQAAKLHYMFGGQFTLPLVIRAVGGGGRQLGATHSQTPDAIFAHFPGLKVIGKSKIQREGKDVTIVTYSKGLELSMKAADELAKDGIQVEIVDLRCLRPLDMDPVLMSFKKTNRAVIVEEGWKSYGVGSEIAARIYEEAFDYVDAPVKRVAQKEVPLPYNRNLEQAALPQVEDVIAAVKEVLK